MSNENDENAQVSGERYEENVLHEDSNQPASPVVSNIFVDFARELPRRKPNFYTQPRIDQLILTAKRDLSWHFRALRQKPGRTVYTDEDWKKVKTVFGVGRRRFFEILDEHQLYELRYCTAADDFDACSAAYFINNPGRPEGSDVSELEAKAIVHAILERSRVSETSTGEIISGVPLPSNIDRLDIYKYARSTSASLTRKKVNNYIDQLLSGNGSSLILYAVHGERWMREHIAPKKDNTAPEVHYWWIFDDHDPRLYINHGGEAVKALVLYGIEGLSGYILGIRVIPKIDWTPEGEKIKVSYTQEDYGLVLATSMHRTGCRPLYIYNDNASAFKALVKYLGMLNNAFEEPLEMKFSLPGQPWSRKIENQNGQLKKFVAEYPGHYWDDESEEAAKANSEALWTAEKWTQEFEAYRNEVNTEHLPDRRRKKQLRPSREDVWKSVLPRPAPPIRRLINLPSPVQPVQEPVRMSHNMTDICSTGVFGLQVR